MSGRENEIHFFRADGFGCVSKGPVLPHFPCGTQKRAKRDTRKRTSNAHASDSNRRKISKTQLNALQTHKGIHRTIDRTHHAAMSSLLARPGAYKNVGACFLISLQPL